MSEEIIKVLDDLGKRFGLAIGIICNITGIMQNLIMPELTIINYLQGVIK